MPDEPDRCPRCGGSFHCGMGAPGPCACTSVALTPATLQALRLRYTGCLCLRCLGELATLGELAALGERASPVEPAASADVRFGGDTANS